MPLDWLLLVVGKRLHIRELYATSRDLQALVKATMAIVGDSNKKYYYPTSLRLGT